MRRLAASLLAASAVALPAPAFAQASHQVSVSFTPRTITMGETAILTVVIRNPQGGGNRSGVNFTLVLPLGLTTAGVNVGPDCYEGSSNPTVVPASVSVQFSGLILRPGGTCTVDVTVAPSAPGRYDYPANSLNVNSNSGSNSNAAGASLTVVPAPDPTAQLSAASVSFGSQQVGTSSGAQAVTLSNNGGSPLAVSAITVSGDFSFSGCSAPASIGPGASCTFLITFVPTATGVRTGSIQVQTAIGERSISLSGTGTAPAITLAPARLDFGGVVVGTQSTANLVVTNAGSAPLVLQAIAASGAFFSTSHDCPASLASLATCTITVRYAPTGVGTHGGQLTVQSNASGGTVTAALAGSGVPVPAPALSLSRISVDFGSQAIDTTSAAQPVTLTNSGNAALALQSISVSGDFGVSGCAAPSSLAAGASCTLSVTFRPAATGTRAGSISIGSDAAGSPHAVALSGAGTAPGVSLSPSPLEFATLVAGASASSAVTLRNTGGATLTVGAIAVSGASFSRSGSCPAALAPNEACSITITFAPAIAGSHSGQLSVSTNAQAAAYVVTLLGSATPPPSPAASLSRTSVVFPSQLLGTTSAAQTVVLTNSGTAALEIAAVSASGDFAVGGCAAATIIPAGGSCSLSITFQPTATGDRLGSIQLASNAAGSPHAIALSGSSFATPGIAISPAALGYGTIATGSNALLRVGVTNTGLAMLEISAIAISGTAFTQTNTCPAALASGASCDIWVTFAPVSSGPHAGQLTIGSNAPTSPSVIALSGFATPALPPTIELSRTAVDFGPQTVGTASGVQEVLVRNTGSSALEILSIAAAGDFGLSGCATPLTLPAGGSCALSITFLPTAVGPRSGSIAISSSASEVAVVVSLSGQGTALPVPGIAVSPSAIAFGSILVGASVVAHVALANTGAAPLALASIAVNGAHFSQANDCPASLAPSAACSISVTYAPGAAGTHAADLAIVSNAVPSPLLVALSGTALPEPAPGVHLSATTLTFAATRVGTASAPRAVTLTNTGTAALAIRSIASTGDFGYSGCGFPSTLAPGDSCQFNVVFTPLAAGLLTGAIEIATDAPSSPHRITLSGTGATVELPQLALRPWSFAFGALRLGATATQRMRLTSVGAVALAITGISVSGPFFTLAHDCPAALPVGADCEIVVAYSPAAVGAHNGQVRIESNAVPNPYVVQLSGSGLTALPPLLVAERSLDFGAQVVGTTGRRILELRNAGEETLVVTGLRLFGSDAFAIDRECASIAPGAACGLALTFAPPALGGFAARLDIVSNHSGGVVQVDLDGAGVAQPLPLLQLSADGLGFGNQVVGTPSDPPRVVRLTNVGSVPVRLGALTGTIDYAIDAGQCPAALQPDRSCDVGVVFRPLVAGPRLGRLVIESNAAGAPHFVSLTGTGCRFFAIGAARNPERLCAP